LRDEPEFPKTKTGVSVIDLGVRFACIVIVVLPWNREFDISLEARVKRLDMRVSCLNAVEFLTIP